jgi:hypothetical protein
MVFSKSSWESGELEYQIMQRNHPLLTLSLKFCQSEWFSSISFRILFRSSELGEKKATSYKIITGLDV